LKADKTLLKWRIDGKGKWHSIRMTTSKSHNDYFAEIPYLPAGSEVEYFVEASSISGKRETMPVTAPVGRFKVLIR
jgi:hypothetical protein